MGFACEVVYRSAGESIWELEMMCYLTHDSVALTQTRPLQRSIITLRP